MRTLAKGKRTVFTFITKIKLQRAKVVICDLGEG